MDVSKFRDRSPCQKPGVKGLRYLQFSSRRMESKPVDRSFEEVQIPASSHSLKKRITSKSTFECDKCFKRFSTKYNLVRHTKEHGEEGRIKCSKCTSYFSSQEKLIEHVAVKHNNQHLCQDCGKRFSSSSSLGRHRRQLHERDSFPCRVCSKLFPNMSCMLEHMNSHSGTKPYACKHCDKKYPRYDTCKRHEKDCLTGAVCSVCGQKFSCKTSLRNHVAANHEMINHLCTACGESFKYRSSLRNHRIRNSH